MTDEISKLFKGLTPQQADELKRRILPAAQELRGKIISGEIEVDGTFDFKGETDPAKVREASKLGKVQRAAQQ